MAHLGTLSGSGLLKVGSEAISVGYRIEVFSNGRSLHVSATMVGHEMALARTFDARGATLITEQGDEIPVVIRNPTGKAPEILLNGPLPGF